MTDREKLEDMVEFLNDYLKDERASLAAWEDCLARGNNKAIDIAEKQIFCDKGSIKALRLTLSYLKALMEED